MATFSVKDVLNGKAPSDASVTVQGWVRTRRDSKAGYPPRPHRWFLLRHFANRGAQHHQQLRKRSLHLTAGASFAATGSIVPSQGGGQSFEMQSRTCRRHGFS